MKKTRTASLSIASVFVMAALGACSQADPEPDESAADAPAVGETGSTGEGGDLVAKASEMVAEYQGIPTWTPPGDPIDARAIADGKLIFSMPVSTDIPYNVAMEEGIKQAVEAAGAEYMTWPNQGQQDQWVQGMNNAMSQGADVIILSSGFDVRTLEPQIAQARDQGIVVVASTFGGETQGCPDFVDACVPMKYETAAEIMVNYAIADTGGDLNALVITANDVYSGGGMIPAVEQTLAENCPDCKAEFIDVTVPNWSSQIQTEVQSALVQDPNINYVICLYDSMTTYVVPALLSAGKAGEVGLTGFNGTPGPMELVAEGSVSLDVGQDIVWAAYGTVDTALRALAEIEPNTGLVNQNIPLRAFDSSNIDDAGNPPSLTEGYGTVAVDGYEDLWGIE